MIPLRHHRPNHCLVGSCSDTTGLTDPIILTSLRVGFYGDQPSWMTDIVWPELKCHFTDFLTRIYRDRSGLVGGGNEVIERQWLF